MSMYNEPEGCKYIAFLTKDNVIENIAIFKNEDLETIPSFYGMLGQELSVSYMVLDNSNSLTCAEIGYEYYEGYFRPQSPGIDFEWLQEFFMWVKSPSEELKTIALGVNQTIIYNSVTQQWMLPKPENSENYFWNEEFNKWIPPKPEEDSFNYIWDNINNSWQEKI